MTPGVASKEFGKVNVRFFFGWMLSLHTFWFNGSAWVSTHFVSFVSFPVGCISKEINVLFVLATYSKGQALQFNYLFERGAFVLQPDETFMVDFSKVLVFVVLVCSVFRTSTQSVQSLKKMITDFGFRLKKVLKV